MDMVQKIVRDREVHLITSCRGTDRYRVGGVDLEGNKYPLRKTVIVGRESGEVGGLRPPSKMD